MVRRNPFLDSGHERKAGCLGVVFVGLWLFTLLLSLATSCAVVAAIVAGAYYLCTGEFICR